MIKVLLYAYEHTSAQRAFIYPYLVIQDVHTGTGAQMNRIGDTCM